MSDRSSHDALHLLADAHHWRCEYCARAVHCQMCEPGELKLSATRDHHVPRAAGGRGGSNIRLACWDCNHLKRDTLPSDAVLAPPRRRAGGLFYSLGEVMSMTGVSGIVLVAGDEETTHG